LLEKAKELAEDVSRQSAEALRAAKRLMRHGQNADFATIMDNCCIILAIYEG